MSRPFSEKRVMTRRRTGSRRLLGSAASSGAGSGGLTPSGGSPRAGECWSTESRWPAALVAGILALCVLAAGVAGARAASIEPAPEVQAEIEVAVDVIVAAGGSMDDPEAVVAVEDLERAAGSRVRLLEQLLLYLSAADGTERAMGGALLLHGLEFTFDEKIAAVVSHLDTTDPDQRRAIYELLSTIDRPDGGTADFTAYARLLRQRGETANGLTRYMYDVDPGVAVRMLQDVHGSASRRTFASFLETIARVEQLAGAREQRAPWTAAERNEFREHLGHLSRSPRWWIRLYAAAMLARVPELASPELVSRLRQDEDERVRALASRSRPDRR